MKDLHLLPKVRDSWSYLYVEHARIEQEAKAIAIHDARGRVSIPCAKLMTLMLGPGTAITHAAVRSLADNGCLVVWCGEEGIRFYAQGMGETRSSANLLHQARMWADPAQRHEVVVRLYQMRFHERLAPSLSLREIRGKEGIRVRRAYEEASRATGVPWHGRSYSAGKWGQADTINRALSAANACLYGICHAAIVSAGFSPALGFIHTGKMLSFVYDIADLYKTRVSVPAAFQAVSEGIVGVERRARTHCREQFKAHRLLAQIIPDIQQALALGTPNDQGESVYDEEQMVPGRIWDPVGEMVGGVNYGDPAGGAAGEAS